MEIHNKVGKSPPAVFCVKEIHNGEVASFKNSLTFAVQEILNNGDAPFDGEIPIPFLLWYGNPQQGGEKTQPSFAVAWKSTTGGKAK